MHNPTPGLPEFDYVKPTSIEEASRFLADHPGESRPFLGGTDTFVRMRDGVWKDRYLVDVKGLQGMDEITFGQRGGLTVGAAVNMNRIIAHPGIQENYPLLAQAARTVASYQLRSRATIVGNICNASPAGDTIGSCIVLNGSLYVHGLTGIRHIALDDFFIGPGQSVLKPGDVVTSIHFPSPRAGQAGRYVKLGRNAVGDLAIVGVTVLGYPDKETVSGYRFRIVLASVAPIPLETYKAEEMLADNPINLELIHQAAEMAGEEATPISDTRGSARYRRLMVRNLARQAIGDVWDVLRNQ